MEANLSRFGKTNLDTQKSQNNADIYEESPVIFFAKLLMRI